MIRQLCGAAFMAGLILTTGCSTIELKSIYADMPTSVVHKYRASGKQCADDALFWIPCLVMEAGNVSKTADGFQANEHHAMGPLASLLLAGGSSEFDGDGGLNSYSSHSCSYYGFFGASMKSGHKKENGEWDRTAISSTSIAWGLLGYEDNSKDGTTYYFLWIPIVRSHGEPKQCANDKTAIAPSARAAGA